ncbi:MAG: hypothetical protein LBO69_01535 [Ignavibacteria bacterium]|jgi:hypothetical protein|nr:hypothetical protein [Ignavibacteria bacterium]
MKKLILFIILLPITLLAEPDVLETRVNQFLGQTFDTLNLSIGTIIVNNREGIPYSGVLLRDGVETNLTYLADSVQRFPGIIIQPYVRVDDSLLLVSSMEPLNLLLVDVQNGEVVLDRVIPIEEKPTDVLVIQYNPGDKNSGEGSGLAIDIEDIELGGVSTVTTSRSVHSAADNSPIRYSSLPSGTYFLYLMESESNTVKFVSLLTK